MGRTIGMLFFSAFAAAGIFCGAITIRSLWQWLDSSNWQSVRATAELLQVDENDTSDGTSYRVLCRYRYRVGTREFVGDRVSFFDVGSGDPDYARNLHRRLFQDNEVGKLQCFVDMSNPSQAVLDRTIRSGLIGATLIFLITHGTIGVGGLAYLWGAKPPRQIDGRWRIVSDHAGTRFAFVCLLILHSITGITAFLVAILGFAGGQWVAILPASLAILAGAIGYGCYRYAFVSHPMTARLLLAAKDDVDPRMRLELLGRVPAPIDFEVRWAVPPADAQQVGAEDVTGEALSVTDVDASVSENPTTIDFLPPKIDPRMLQSSGQGHPSTVKLEIVGRLGTRGYSDTFKLSGELLQTLD